VAAAKEGKPMAVRPAKVWGYAGARADKKPPDAKKLVITAACEQLIRDYYLPKFLPTVRPATDHNYPINIYGKWLGNKYRFITRYHCVHPGAPEEFDAPFARLECGTGDNYDVSWHRHTGEWHTVFRGLDLSGAMDALKAEFFYPC
jgi:hypothetical protein